MTEATQPTTDAGLTDHRARHPILFDALRTLLLALIIFLTARLLLLPYQVDGRSMTPNLVDEERVLVNRAVYMHFDMDRWLGWFPGLRLPEEDYYPFHSPERGDIVVLNPPAASDEPFIKRTIAVAGDSISIQDGSVYVNDARIEEPYLNGIATACHSDRYCMDFVVPAGTIFVMGDNRGDSFDSREFGPVPLENVIGQAWFSNWPADRFGLIPDIELEVAGPEH